MPTENTGTPVVQGPSDYQLASVVAPHVSLNNISMMAVSALLKKPLRDAIVDMTKHNVTAKIDWKAAHELDESGLEVSVRIDFQVELGESPKDGLTTVVVSASYVLIYKLDSQPPGETREGLLGAFAKVNGVYNAWPYLRELVQTTCARMNLPPPVLPVYRVPRPPRKVPATKAQAEPAELK